MTLALVSRMVRSSLATAQDALDQQAQEFTAEEVTDLFDAYALTRSLIGSLREANERTMAHGAEGRRLSFVLKESRDAIRAGVVIIDKVLEVVSTTSPPAKDSGPSIQELKDAREMAACLLKKYGEIIDWLDAPPPQVDPEVLERARKGPFVKLDGILTRLKAGEDA